MSKHHAADEEPQSSDESWIHGLAKPVPADEPRLLPFYGSLVAPELTRSRHAASDDDDATPASTDHPSVPVPAGSHRRISAAQVDTLIQHLDAVPSSATAPEAPSDDLGLFADADEADEEDFEAADTEQESTQQDSTGQDSTGQDSTGQDSTGQDSTGQDSTELDDGDRSVADADRTRASWLRKPVLIGAVALVCLLTVGGSVSGGGSASAKTKTVSIVVDGQAQQVKTLSDSVAGALSAAGLSPHTHDTLAPGLNTPISDGSTIVLDRARLLTLTVDGKPRQIWTTARTVDQALDQIGTKTTGLQLSANRSRAIPLDGLTVTAVTMRSVAVSLAGASAVAATTSAPTVGDLLTEQKITLGPRDKVSPAVSTPLADGLVIKVDRVAIRSTTATVVLPQPAASTVPDPTIVKGTSQVVQAGRTGSQLITYTVTTVNGRPTAKVEAGRRVTAVPLGTITHVGTKTTFTYSGNEVFTNDTTFGVNWDGLANCESTHNPKAINANPSAGLPTYGLFQFDLPTWASVGGSGNPIDATPEEQLARAKMLYSSRGLEPWACRDAAH